MQACTIDWPTAAWVVSICQCCCAPRIYQSLSSVCNGKEMNKGKQDFTALLKEIRS